MTDHLPGDDCPACLADRDQRHARIVEVRNACSVWAEAGFFAGQQGNIAAANIASQHLLTAFYTLDEYDRAIAVNHLFVNTVAHVAVGFGGVGDWLEGMEPDRRDWLTGFVASDGRECTCAYPHGQLEGDGEFFPVHLTEIPADGEPV